MDLKALWRKFIKSKINEIALFIITIAKKKKRNSKNNNTQKLSGVAINFK